MNKISKVFMDGIKSGSVLGGVLLVAGSCIGAGMLAVPVITGMAGFVPSTFMFLFAWAFMTATALLLLEANLSMGHHLSLISLSQKTLGTWGKGATWFFFLFLFYSLNVAYIAASGPIVQGLIKNIFEISLPPWAGSLGFTLLFAIVIYYGVRPVDYLNRILMIGLIIAYFALVFLGAFYIEKANLLQGQLKYALVTLPILIISFGFHNMIPTLADYFKGNVRKLKITIYLGSVIPLLIYLVWEAIMLGIIPIEGKAGLMEGLKEGVPVTEVLHDLLGTSWVSSVAEAFSLFAITTSFLAQSLSFVDFLSDGLKISKEGQSRVFLITITLLPPFIAAFLYPRVFIHALNMAGGLSAVILFGVFPALMAWKVRKKKEHEPILGGGKSLLLLVLIFALAIFFFQLAEELGWSLLPKDVGAPTC